MRKRLMALVSSLALAFSFAVAAPVVNPDIASTAQADISICSGFIAVDLYTGWNFDMIGSQFKKRFCGNSTNSIAVPNLGAYVGMNNDVSSLKVFNAGTSRCIRYYDATNYLGTTVTSKGNVVWSSMGSFDNKMSSLKTISLC